MSTEIVAGKSRSGYYAVAVVHDGKLDKVYFLPDADVRHLYDQLGQQLGRDSVWKRYEAEQQENRTLRRKIAGLKGALSKKPRCT